MKLKLAIAGVILAVVFVSLLFPRTVETKEGFFLKLGNAADDISVLSVGFSHTYHFLKPAAMDVVCFEDKNISFIASGEISALELPIVFADEKFCSDSKEIELNLENRGDYVALQQKS